MRIRWRDFELPSRVELDRNVSTETYGRFYIEPFQRGFGTTIGNGLRRVLLSSIQGAALVSVKIEGVLHEFSTIDGVYEDMTNVILNLKKLRLNVESQDSVEMMIDVDRKGEITAADIDHPAGVKIINPDLKICTLTDNVRFVATLVARRGRGYLTAEENIVDGQELGTIPIDSLFSPVYRVRYAVEATRLGKDTNYDRLVLEIWTDGTINPEMALVEASKIYRKHLNPFVQYFELQQEAEAEAITLDVPTQEAGQSSELDQVLDQSLDRLNLSVRAKNCLDSENIMTVRELVSLTEAELLKVRNFGKTSLKEVKVKLSEMGLGLGMQVPPKINA
ncbi:MAG: DNA-directed RNA polymerase subunit alpha [Planctomycetes bacterium]|nr:DNA-directed RNA polymerase subunit alpha [Planctomycetota bacterium]